MSNFCHKNVTRRCAIALGVKTVPIAVIAASSLSILQSCGSSSTKNTETATETDSKTATGTGTGAALTLSFSQYPSLETTGGSVPAKINGSDVYVTRVSTDKVITVSTLCTHEQCPINAYNASNQQYFCPCHGSMFNADGSVAVGPAKRALKTYPSTITKTGVSITT